MEQIAGLKNAEGKLSVTSDKVTALGGKLEDLLFRAQRISSAAKNGMKNNDSMFGYDLQNFRREVRTFSNDISALPNLVGTLERAATYDENAVRYAQSMMRIADRLSKNLRGLHDQACLAHSHIREAEFKVEAWYLVQEIEEMAQRGATLPTIANKVVIKVSTPDKKNPPPPSQPPVLPPPQPPPQPK